MSQINNYSKDFNDNSDDKEDDKLNSKYFLKIKNIFINKKPNIVYGLTLTINNYKNIIDYWKKYLLGEKLIIPDEYSLTITEVFKFHYNITDHVIMFQSYNLSNSLLMCRIDRKFFNIIIPKIPVDNTNGISIIATFT